MTKSKYVKAKSSQVEVKGSTNKSKRTCKYRGSKSTTGFKQSPKGVGSFIPKNQVAEEQKLKGSSDYFHGQKAMMKNKLLYIEQMLVEVANQFNGLKADIR